MFWTYQGLKKVGVGDLSGGGGVAVAHDLWFVGGGGGVHIEWL